MTITEFLLARIAEDEAVARAWRTRIDQGEIPILFHGVVIPDRVLAECAAKRRIVEGWRDEYHDTWVLMHLASVYADHPDYDPAWATDTPG